MNDRSMTAVRVHARSVPARRAALLGMTLALVLALPSLAGAALLVGHVSITPVTLLLSMAAIATWAWMSFGADRVAVLVAAAAITCGAFLISARLFDLSFDGQTYHQVAVRALARGWNPVWAPSAADSMPFHTHVAGLPKAAWIWEAMAFRLTGSLEAGKASQLIALAAAFLLAWAALEAWGVSRRRALAIAALAAANPVALTQLVSFYVDGLVASGTVIVAALSALWWKAPDRTGAIAIAAMAAFVANLKFPALVDLTLIAAFLILCAALAGRRRLRDAMTVAGLAVVLAALEGINPYATNTVLHHNPAYPAAGPDAIALVIHRDPEFVAQGRVVQFARSLFSRSSDDDEAAPRLKFPFTVHAGELAAFSTLDTRIGGWGPLFGGALIVATAILVLGVASRRPGAAVLALASVAILVSPLALPLGYYSRYAPQVWLACIPALLLDIRARSLQGVLALLLAVNTSMVAGISLGSQLFLERLHRAQLRQLALDAGSGPLVYRFVDEPFVNVDLHFDAFGIRSRAVDSLRCAIPALVLSTHALVCLPNDRSPARPPDPAEAAAPLLRFLGLR